MPLVPLGTLVGGTGPGGPITSTDITDSTPMGRSILSAVDAPSVRAAIGAGTSNLTLGSSSSTAKPGDWKPAAADISDATPLGRDLVKAADSSAARAAIGAGTSSLTLGTTASTAKPGNWKPTVDDLADAGADPKALLKATSKASARGAIDAAADGDVVKVSGAQDVAGTKTFSDPPVVPTPTANGHATPKAYVDAGLNSRPTSTNVKTFAYGTTLPTSGNEGDVFFLVAP